MKRTLLVVALGIAGLLATAGIAAAQIAGSTTVGITVAESTQLALGWSVKKTLLGKSVYNDAGEKIGEVEDLIIAPDRSVSYLIVGAGGFISIGRHDVAIPVAQVRDQGGKLVLPGASKDAIKSMPAFDYASDTTRRDEFVAGVEQDIVKAKAKVSALQGDARAAGADTKAKLDLQIVGLQTDLKVAEDGLADLKRASVNRWREFEGDLNAATDRLRKSYRTAPA